MEPGEFHWTDGWYFKRLEDGFVRIQMRQHPPGDSMATAVIPPAGWASIISFLSERGEPAAYEDDVKFHSGQKIG